MAPTGHESTPGGWQWADDAPGKAEPESKPSPSSTEYIPNPRAPAPDPSQTRPSSNQHQQKPRRYYKPRTCRICLETVQPTFHSPSLDNPNTPSFLSGRPYVSYESPDLGRLLRPCKCKGTSAYVHEVCLSTWRHADPHYSKRNYWQCPTCGYRYRLQRLGIGRVVSSVTAQVGLTLAIVFAVVFILGFVADPIINFCLDPAGSLSAMAWGWGWTRPPRGYEFYDGYGFVPDDEEKNTWAQHMTKGFASLGLLSFFKVIFTSPWQLFFRNSWGSRATGASGRERLNNTTWVLVLIGAATFLYVSVLNGRMRVGVIIYLNLENWTWCTDIQQSVWKGVRGWSRRTLERAGERVMDVQGANDDDEDEGEAPT